MKIKYTFKRKEILRRLDILLSNVKLSGQTYLVASKLKDDLMALLPQELSTKTKKIKQMKYTPHNIQSTNKINNPEPICSACGETWAIGHICWAYIKPNPTEQHLIEPLYYQYFSEEHQPTLNALFNDKINELAEALNKLRRGEKC